MKTTQGINYRKTDGTEVDLETQLGGIETTVGQHTDQIGKLQTGVENAYSPTNLPSRCTCEHGNEFNPYVNCSESIVAFNVRNEVEGVTQTFINFENGKGNYTSIAAARVYINYYALKILQSTMDYFQTQ